MLRPEKMVPGLMLQRTMDTARQRRRFRVMGSNFPATGLVSLLLLAQQSAQPKALFPPMKTSIPSKRELFRDNADKCRK